MSLSAYERETIISFSDGDDVAIVYTAQRKIATRLKKIKLAKLVETGKLEGKIISWTFELPRGLITIRSKFRKGKPPRVSSPEISKTGDTTTKFKDIFDG